MSWDFRLGKIAGIQLKLHWTIFLAPAYVAFLGYYHQVPFLQQVVLFGLMLAVFGCVLIHELGHALSARYFAVHTMDIVLTPFGGLARLSGRPVDSRHEMWIAIAGPFANLLIAFLLGCLLLLLRQPVWTVPPLTETYSFWRLLFWANIVLCFVNLMPVYPMDGGRVLRSLLTAHFPAKKATVIAQNVGVVIALGIAAAGVITMQLSLLLVALVLAVLVSIH